MPKLRSIPGTFDVLPVPLDQGGTTIPASAAWRAVEDTVREVLGRFHLQEIRTPTMEPLALVARGVGQTTDIVQKEMFTVERGDDAFVLRPEVTAPVMRAYLQHHLAQRGGTQRLFYIGPCFRAERPQKGRYRQFHQFGVELIGSAAPEADAECIAAMLAVYRELGIGGTRLRLNTLGEPAERSAFRDALRQFLTPHAGVLSETSRQRLDTNPLRILDTKDPDEQALLEDAPSLKDFVGEESQAHFDRVRRLLDALGVDYTVDPRLVRGLDYYTRTAWELEGDGLGSQSALAGGGRYDGLATAIGSGQPVPAVGFAAGMERLFMALDAAGQPLQEPTPPDVFLVGLGDRATAWTFETAQRLRAGGLRVAYDLKGRSLKAQMKEADRQGAQHAVIVGSSELDAGEAQLRDLGASTQRAVPLSELDAALRALVSD